MKSGFNVWKVYMVVELMSNTALYNLKWYTDPIIPKKNCTCCFFSDVSPVCNKCKYRIKHLTHALSSCSKLYFTGNVSFTVPLRPERWEPDPLMTILEATSSPVWDCSCEKVDLTSMGIRHRTYI